MRFARRHPFLLARGASSLLLCELCALLCVFCVILAFLPLSR
jgi:hypothetical protein